MDITDKTSGKQGGHRFPKGVSGNPKGRPKGTRNRATIMAEALLEGQAEALVQKGVSMALKGNTTALRLCLERLIPPRREPTVQDATVKQDELPRHIKIDLSDFSDEELELMEKMGAKIESNPANQSEARDKVILV
ncbi:MAG: DUF5681 domain-containing protein [Planctomycetota bacterium]|jgi:hypothetical protein